MKLIIRLVLTVLFMATGTGIAQDLSGLGLIAQYPLISDANDATGHYGPMALKNAPFQNGGVYINGNYAGTQADSSDYETPYLTGFSFSRFAISINFMVSEYPTTDLPIFVGGLSWRWISAWVGADSTIKFRWDDHYPNDTGVTYSLNTWHTVMVVYDSTTATAAGFLDGVNAEAATGITLSHGNDRNIVASHGGISVVFKGHVNNLLVFSEIANTHVIDRAESVPTELQLQQNYPNPFNPETVIAFILPEAGYVNLSVFDIKGRLVTTLVDEELQAGTYKQLWKGVDISRKAVPSGTYFYRLKSGDQVLSAKMILSR